MGPKFARRTIVRILTELRCGSFRLPRRESALKVTCTILAIAALVPVELSYGVSAITGVSRGPHIPFSQIPEPAILALLGAAMLLFAAGAKRRYSAPWEAKKVVPAFEQALRLNPSFEAARETRTVLAGISQ